MNTMKGRFAIIIFVPLFMLFAIPRTLLPMFLQVDEPVVVAVFDLLS